MTTHAVVIAGAGPTGMMLAAELKVEFARPAYYTVNGDLLGPEMRVTVRRLRRISVIRG